MNKKGAGFLINLILLLILFCILGFMVFSVIVDSTSISGNLISQLDHSITGNAVYTDATCNGCIGGTWSQNCHPIGYVHLGTLKCVSDNLWQKIETTVQITNQTNSSVSTNQVTAPLVATQIKIINPSKTYNILTMGDSNTMGAGNPSGCASASCAIGYRKDLKNLLAAKGIKTDFQGSQKSGCSAMGDCQHEGYPGMGIATLQSRVNSGIIQKTNPDFVIILVGSNDMWKAVQPVSARSPISTSQARVVVKNLNNLISSIVSKNKEMSIIIAKPATPSNSKAPLAVYRSGIDQIAKDFSSKGYHVYSVDFASAKNDGVHYTPAGFNKIAQILTNQIYSIIQKNSNSNTVNPVNPVVIEENDKEENNSIKITNLTSSASNSDNAGTISNSDEDKDGVINTEDLCPATPLRSKVNKNGCLMPKWDKFNKNYKSGGLIGIAKELKISNENGSILFQNEVSIEREEGNLNLDENINIESNKLILNSENLPELNTKATLVFNNITLINPRISIDGKKCAECKILSYDNGILVVEVEHFSTYEVVEEEVYNTLPEDNSQNQTIQETGPELNYTLNNTLNETFQEPLLNDSNLSENLIKEQDNAEALSETESLIEPPRDYSWIYLLIFLIGFAISLFFLWKKIKKNKSEENKKVLFNQPRYLTQRFSRY